MATRNVDVTAPFRRIIVSGALAGTVGTTYTLRERGPVYARSHFLRSAAVTPTAGGAPRACFESRPASFGYPTAAGGDRDLGLVRPEAGRRPVKCVTEPSRADARTSNAGRRASRGGADPDRDRDPVRRRISPDFRERFEPGAFGEVGAVDLNLQHMTPGVILVRGATLTDGPRELCRDRGPFPIRSCRARSRP